MTFNLYLERERRRWSRWSYKHTIQIQIEFTTPTKLLPRATRKIYCHRAADPVYQRNEIRRLYSRTKTIWQYFCEVRLHNCMPCDKHGLCQNWRTRWTVCFRMLALRRGFLRISAKKPLWNGMDFSSSKQCNWGVKYNAQNEALKV